MRVLWKSWEYALHRPQAEEARLPPAVDHAHQRRVPRERHHVLALDRRAEEAAASSLDRKVLADMAVERHRDVQKLTELAAKAD